MSHIKRPIALTLLVSLTMALVLLPSALAAPRQRVTVRSNNYRYNYYRVEVSGRVELVNQISSAPCEYGRSWGYDRDGIWVDNGCSAEFEIYDYYDNNNRGRVSGKTAAIIAGAAGAAILTGVLVAKNRKDKKNQTTTAGKNDNSGPKEQVPDWLVGTFESRTKQTEIGIYDDGTVVVRQGNRDRYYGNYYDGKIFYNGVKLKIVQDRDGFTATDLSTKESIRYERKA